MPELKPYQPIGCKFYDELELLSIRQSPVQLLFETKEGKVRELSTTISDLFSHDKQEFLKTKEGVVIRLDQIISINGEPLTFSC